MAVFGGLIALFAAEAWPLPGVLLPVAASVVTGLVICVAVGRLEGRES